MLASGSGVVTQTGRLRRRKRLGCARAALSQLREFHNWIEHSRDKTQCNNDGRGRKTTSCGRNRRCAHNLDLYQAARGVRVPILTLLPLALSPRLPVSLSFTVTCYNGRKLPAHQPMAQRRPARQASAAKGLASRNHCTTRHLCQRLDLCCSQSPLCYTSTATASCSDSCSWQRADSTKESCHFETAQQHNIWQCQCTRTLTKSAILQCTLKALWQTQVSQCKSLAVSESWRVARTRTRTQSYFSASRGSRGIKVFIDTTATTSASAVCAVSGSIKRSAAVLHCAPEWNALCTGDTWQHTRSVLLPPHDGDLASASPNMSSMRDTSAYYRTAHASARTRLADLTTVVFAAKPRCTWRRRHPHDPPHSGHRSLRHAFRDLCPPHPRASLRPTALLDVLHRPPQSPLFT